jgi:phage I-like protein
MPARTGMVSHDATGQSAGMFQDNPHHVSLHAATPSGAVALCASVNLPTDDADAPEWVHLLPAGEIRTGDGRGPYRIGDAAALIVASREFGGDRLPIDENHATDLAAPRGDPAPARGWIVELQHRQDGIWGRVEWTAHGKRLVTGRAYRGLSPVIQHQKTGEVTAILRASLVNRPNLRGLTALHQETNMNLLEKLLKALGLPAETTEDQLVDKVAKIAGDRDDDTAMHSAMSSIAKAVGLAEDADAPAIVLGVQSLKKATGSDDAVTALQAELASVTTKLNTLTDATKKTAAENFVDGAVKLGRVGVKPLRDRYVTMHMADPAGTEELVNAMPVLGAGGSIVPPTPPAREGEIALQSEQLAVAKMLGIDPKDYAETLKQERVEAL